MSTKKRKGKTMQANLKEMTPERTILTRTLRALSFVLALAATTSLAQYGLTIDEYGNGSLTGVSTNPLPVHGVLALDPVSGITTLCYDVTTYEQQIDFTFASGDVLISKPAGTNVSDLVRFEQDNPAHPGAFIYFFSAAAPGDLNPAPADVGVPPVFGTNSFAMETAAGGTNQAVYHPTVSAQAGFVPQAPGAVTYTFISDVPAGHVGPTFTALHSFGATATNASGLYTNSDGANPYAGFTVTASDGTRYGTASTGGSAGYGTVFAINADGTGFTVLHTFNYAEGGMPWTGLVLSGNTLYGTTYVGGSSGQGTVFAINTDGTEFTNLYTFGGGSDGAHPNGGLILSGNTLYGTAAYGGILGLTSGYGTVFAINADGSGFKMLHAFTPTVLERFYDHDEFGREYYIEMQLNTDGAIPVSGLILAGNTLFGTATGGGTGGNGTVFSLNTDGTEFTTLHSFEQTYNQTRYPIYGGNPGGFPGGYCSGGGCGAGSQCVGGFCGCSGFCSGGG